MSKRAGYEKAKRERLKAAGLEKVEFWITPENKATLKKYEEDFRKKELVVIFDHDNGDVMLTLKGDDNG